MWQHPPPIKSGADVLVTSNLVTGSANGRELLAHHRGPVVDPPLFRVSVSGRLVVVGERQRVRDVTNVVLDDRDVCRLVHHGRDRVHVQAVERNDALERSPRRDPQ